MNSRKPAHTTQKLLIVILTLLVIGLLVISSSTSVYSQSLYGNPFKFVFLQIGWILLGLIGFYLFYKFDYTKLEKVSYIMYVITVVFLVLLAIVGFLPCEKSISFIPCINGANRWFFLNPPPLPEVPFLGVLGFQPGEFAKLTLIVYLAVQLTKNIKRREETFLVYAVVSGLTALLILFQPNMSTAVMVFTLGSIVYFSSDAPLGTLFKIAPVAFVVIVIMILASPYRRQRLIGLIKMRDAESSYHMEQILISLGSGGLTGVGFGQSMQKFHYLPEIASDSIFALIGEEFGFVGTTSLVLIFTYLMFLGFTIAQDSPDMLGRLLAVGITSWISLQFFINTAAMTGLIPLTGVPMPLISYGGSSMVFSLMGMGILASISRQSESKT